MTFRYNAEICYALTISLIYVYLLRFFDTARTDCVLHKFTTPTVHLFIYAADTAVPSRMLIFTVV